MKLLTFFAILVIIYYLFRWFVRFALPLMARFFLKKAVKQQQEYYNRAKNQYNESNNRYQGNKKTRGHPNQEKQPEPEGEYIDFEEVN